MNWIKCANKLPDTQTDVLIYVKWPGDPEFTIQIDRWEVDRYNENGGFWLLIQDHCDFVETVADGPGFCNMPNVTHWMPLPNKPSEDPGD